MVDSLKRRLSAIAKQDSSKIKTKLNAYKIKRNEYLKKRKFFIFISIVLIIVFCILSYIFINNYFKNDEPKIKDDIVYVSEILDHDFCDNRSYLLLIFTFSLLFIC